MAECVANDDVKMLRPSIDAMFKGKESRYALVMGIAKRAREISDELEGTVLEKIEKPVKMAEKEFKAHKYVILEPDINS